MNAATATDMDLRQLFPGLATAAVDVTDVATHSAEVVPGGLFLACAGRSGHGLGFLGEALGHGARAVAWETGVGVREPALPPGVAGVAVPGLTAQLGAIGNRFYASPSAALAVTGITGTNGKTTVAWLVTQALGRLGRQAAYMGTLGYGLGTRLRPDRLTTPGCIAVHRRLRELLDAGARDVVAEVSSHALDQGRVDGVRFRTVAFTNLSRDHLDYHGDLERYGRAKARLFLETDAECAVINIGDAFGRTLLARLPARMRRVSVATSGSDAPAAPAVVRARRSGGTAPGARLHLHFEIAGEDVELTTPLAGGFNVENLAVAAGILHAQGFAAADIAAALGSAGAPPGRMERIGGGCPTVIVDFAHTPDALRRVLEALRAESQGRLWCVFGCGGERDAGKRPLMGAVACELADRVIVTDDNPRREDADAIVAAILAGAVAGAPVEVIRDRAAAIRHAIAAATREDLVLIAGKGHETTQTIGRETRPFSDQAVASAALAERA
jgi:UDP-N-acetylmuramoyl-L-alanyl-D-glutamate--2,6-diaminopimelate ligase